MIQQEDGLNEKHKYFMNAKGKERCIRKSAVSFKKAFIGFIKILFN